MGAPAPRELLRLATAGSVDDGKSTLIGRLLHDTGSLPLDHLEAVIDDAGVPDLAALSDGLRAEREQGITIDVAYRFFSTAKRGFILADTPGHERYTRNMFTGASNAHLAVLLVDARAGVVRQTRRHARIATLLGVPHLVATVNKMDLVDFDRARFEEVAAELRELAALLGGVELTVVPIAAKHGDNVVHRSQRTPWYEGPTLMEHLEDVEVTAPDHGAGGLRLPVQWVSRPEDGRRRRYAGRLAAGTLRAGDEVLVLPSRVRTRVSAIDTLDPGRTVAVPPLSVSVELADEVDVGRGDLLVRAGDEPVPARELVAGVCWMSETPLRAGDRLALKHTTRTVRATVQALHDRLDPETLHEFPDPVHLELNDIGTVTLRTSSDVLADPYERNRETGAFILVDEHTNDTVGAGTVLRASPAPAPQRHREDVTWHPSSLRREHRVRATGQRGATVWLTGLPASGKSTVAVALERSLVESGRVAYLLDGDNVRHGLSDDLGFSPGDRAEHVRRVGHLTRLFADAGVVAIASMVSPLRSDRAVARSMNEAAGIPFLEVHVATPVEECERRDPKGLYARARSGQLTGLTGVDAPYEPPEAPDVVIDTTGADLDDLVQRVLAALHAREQHEQHEEGRA
ncbi:adenylyl-sulfate kinase [Kineococcus gypseus]|uniref:adenylyl-sulfate kinase n=1 Tax=Kineococcus gypseus TaxID=1637102 RepID=UPI003D7E2E05